MITRVARWRTDRLTTLGVRSLRTRWLVRAPIWLYRARLGALLGARSLMLEHTVSGFGARSQWSATLARYAHAHPRARDHQRPVIEAAIGGSIEERSSELPMMTLEAAADRTRRRRTHRC